MTFVSDQFEVEIMDTYSGSYTDNIFTPGTVLNETRKVYMSNVNSAATTGSLKEGFKLNSLTNLAPLFGRGLRVGLTDVNFWDTTNLINVFLEITGSSEIPLENIPSPSQNLLLKVFSPTERIADTVLPRPPDIAKINGAQFSEGVGEFMYPNGQQLSFLGAEFAIVPTTGTVSRIPKTFNLTLGSHESSLTSSVDGTVVSDNIWAYSFPFENKYKALERLINPSFDKKYKIKLSQSLAIAQSVSGVELSGGLDISCKAHPKDYTSPYYTLQYCFSTKGLQGPWPNKRRYITLLKTATSVSNGIFKPINNNHYPDINFIYKGFYGFFKDNNATPPYKSSLEGLQNPTWITGTPGNPATGGTTPSSSTGFLSPGGTNITRPLRHNGFGKFLSKNQLKNGGRFPINTACNGYTPDGGWESFNGASGNILATISQYAVIDFNNFYLRITGWKYGAYSGIPANSFCYWRRSKYGQFRDMLEQRLVTKFYDVSTGRKLDAAVRITFIDGTEVAVTASNQNLNTLDSGLFDIEGKSGRPFNDREAED